MQSPPVTVNELIEENRRLRQAHERETESLRATLRDQFAMHAPLTETVMRVIHEMVTARGLSADDHESAMFDEAVRFAWKYADAMLALRNT